MSFKVESDFSSYIYLSERSSKRQHGSGHSDASDSLDFSDAGDNRAQETKSCSSDRDFVEEQVLFCFLVVMIISLHNRYLLKFLLLSLFSKLPWEL